MFSSIDTLNNNTIKDKDNREHNIKATACPRLNGLLKPLGQRQRKKERRETIQNIFI
jgi:hypothetical protein